MGEIRNLKNLSKNISVNLLDAINLADILSDIADGDRKMCTLIETIKHNIKKSFNDIETIRELISVPD